MLFAVKHFGTAKKDNIMFSVSVVDGTVIAAKTAGQFHREVDIGIAK